MSRIYWSFVSKGCSDECQLISTADWNSKPEHNNTADMARFPRIFGQKKRGLQQTKERFARKVTKRVLQTASTQEKEEHLQDNLDSLNDSEKMSPEEVAIWQLSIDKRRRMATCKQLEKITKVISDRNVTLYDLRKALVVVNHLENYGLL